MLGEIVGGLIGGVLGLHVRAARLRRIEEAARRGEDVRVRVLAHPASAPDWRYWPGALTRRDGVVRWRPLVRRWRSFELDGTIVVSTPIRRSAASGDRTLMQLDPVGRCDHLAVPVDHAGIVEAMLSPS